MKEPDNELFGRPIEDIINGYFFSPFFANVREDDLHYLLEVSVPGFRSEDLVICLENELLVLSAKSDRYARGQSRRIEFLRDYFERRFVMPEDADHLNAWIKLEHGVLTVRFQKRLSNGNNDEIKIALM